MRFFEVIVPPLRTVVGGSEKFGTRSTCWMEPVLVTLNPSLYVASSENPVALGGIVTTVPEAFPDGVNVHENVASPVLPVEALASPLLGLPARTWRTLPSKPTIETVGASTCTPGEKYAALAPFWLVVFNPR